MLFDKGTTEKFESAPKKTRRPTIPGVKDRARIGDVAMRPLPRNADAIELKATVVTVVEIGRSRMVVEEENRCPRRRGFDPTFASVWFTSRMPVGERTSVRVKWWMSRVWEKLLFGWTSEMSS